MRVCGKKLGFAIVFAILLTFVFSSMVFAYTPGSSSFETGEGESSGVPINYDGSEENFNNMFLDFGGQYLFLELGMVCNSPVRDDGNSPIVIYDSVRRYGVMAGERIYYDQDTESLAGQRIDEYLSGFQDYGDLMDYVNPAHSGYETLPSAFDLFSKLGEEWDDITVSIPKAVENPISTGGESATPMLYRYEGVGNHGGGDFSDYGCQYYERLMHVFNLRDLTGTSLATNAYAVAYGPGQTKVQNFGDFFEAGKVDHPVELDKDLETREFLDEDDYALNIEWDANQEQCEIIGGDWLEVEGHEEQYYLPDSGYKRACCGDDSIWIRNIQVDYDPSLNLNDIDLEIYAAQDAGDEELESEIRHRYCLYGGEINDVGEGHRCLSRPETYLLAEDNEGSVFHIAYFREMEDDDVNDGSSVINSPYDPYFFIEEGESLYETDEGKWSSGYNVDDYTNPFYCHHYFDPEEGDNYQWYAFNKGSSLGDAMDINPDICERLGGAWTGSYCCGIRYNYEDPNYATDGEYINVSYSDPTYEHEYTDVDGDLTTWTDPTAYAFSNPACVDSQLLLNGETTFKNTTSFEEIEILNANGILYGCNLDETDQMGLEYDYYDDTEYLINVDRNLPICSVVLTDSVDNVCGYNSDWHALSDSYASDTLLYDGTSEEALLSTIRWDIEVDVQPEECCFGGGCWDGTTCVVETSLYYDEEDQYSCIGSEWIGPLEDSQDWYDYDDTALPCPYEYSCVGASEDGVYDFDEDDYDNFCSKNIDYLKSGCTQTEGFYIEDHYCEYDGSNQAQWTSRTKYVAMQLLDMATKLGLTEYTLFCDNYENAINHYSVIGDTALPDEVNSFCVLHTGTESWLGVSVNLDIDAMEFDEDEEDFIDDIEEVLFDNNGLIYGVLAEGIDWDDCEDAFDLTDLTGFGTYIGCNNDDDKIWINDATFSVIFNEDGFTTYGTEIPPFDLDDGNDFFNEKLDLIVDFATNDPDASADNMDRIETVNGFNRIFIQYDGTNYIFGFEEPKYDGSSHIKNYMGVLYEGQAIDCDTVNEAMEGVSYCTEDDGSGNSIVIERSTDGSDHWTDLTAELR
jgi:hypothetical protein